MKKFLLSAFTLVISTATFSQQARIAKMSNDNLKKAYSAMSITPNTPPSTAAPAPVSIWENDCSNPSTWVYTNTSVGTALDWEHTTNIDIQSQCVTAVPTALQTFNSATGSNGFMIINSDAAPGNADNNGSPIVCEFTNADPIDLTGYPNVQLTYQHSFRWWQDTRGVRVSGDNGVTWTDFEITDFANYSTPAQDSDNPQIKRLVGSEGELGAAFGLDNEWSLRIIEQVGNYGESYKKHIADTGILPDRGPNALWTKGGILYVPPAR